MLLAGGLLVLLIISQISKALAALAGLNIQFHALSSLYKVKILGFFFSSFNPLGVSDMGFPL